MVVLPGSFFLLIRHARSKAASYEPPPGAERWGQ